MKGAIHVVLALALAGLLADPGRAHFNMLLPEKASVRKGEAVAFVYQWGHPFEHELFDAPTPQAVSVLAPDGKKTDLGKALQQGGSSGHLRYRFRFTPEQRGDFVFTLTTPPIWMAEEEVFFQDTVKVVLHVQAQGGWDAAAGQDFELLPLTRPYGSEPGMVFQAQALAGGKSLAGALVEVEHYNPTPPRDLPPDEHITRTARTDPNGVVTCTLTEPGWWCVTAERDGGTHEHDGKAYPVRQRSTLWVFVDEKAAPK
jgi:cobalt/nickel transport protein